MNNDDALYVLGIAAAEDPSAVQRAYERRRLECEQKLSTASTEGLKQKYHRTLSDIDEAYRLLVGDTDSTVRRKQRAANSANASSISNVSTGGTLLRAANPAANELSAGYVLADRYEIRRVLGQGGMGAVYEAFDRLKQEAVAIKVLLPQFLSSEQGRERFMHEAKVACRLSHPNIVKVFDVGLAAPYHFITMELLEGRTLREQMEARKAARERYSVPEVLGCARQLIEALQYAHKQIVHRDLKPENVWLCADGTLKLIDFGIARAFTKSALTRTGIVMGTAYYMAPEQFDGAKNVDWRADQYSLAVMLYEMLTGRIPQGTFASTSELRKDVPLPLSHALMKALAPDPGGRFDSLAEFGTALSTTRRPRTAIHSTALWSMGTAAAAVLIVGGLWAGGVFEHPGEHSGAPVSVATSVDAPVAAQTADAAQPTTESQAATEPIAPATDNLAAVTLEGEVQSLYRRLQAKEQELADRVRQQQTRYDGDLADVTKSPNAAARSTAQAILLRDDRELQVRRAIQQEARAKVFSERQWGDRAGQVHAGESLLHDNDVDAATAQFTATRDRLLADAKLEGSIERFVRARADYFDARQPWLDYSIRHGGIAPANPAIRTAESGIQPAIDRGDYDTLATDIFPRLARLYSDELRTIKLRTAQQTHVADSAKSGGNAYRTAATPTAEEQSHEEQPQRPKTKAEIRAERRRAALLAKCARARHRPRNCPPPETK